MEYQGTILMEKYELGRLLGQGTFAKVYFARNIKTGQSVAIKILSKEKIMRNNLIEPVKREIRVMRMVKHPNIVELYEVMATKTKIYFVLEYAKGGELYDKIAKRRLTEDVAQKYFRQLINAVDYCHSRGIYHRDLKLENILLDDEENLKISDFGLSALVNLSADAVLLHTACGTPAYVAPEVINRREYNGAKADIWSCGVLLFVFLAGYLPFHDPNLMDLYRKIRKGEFKCPRWFPSEVRKLLVRMLDPNPSTRITLAEIKENKWFKRELEGKLKHEAETREQVTTDVTATSNSAGDSSSDGRQESTGIAHLNAFDIISLSIGLDLSNFFGGVGHKKEVWFTAWKPASTILSELERVAKSLKLKVKKKEVAVVRMEGHKEGRKGVLSIDAEIFEVTSSFHLVEIKKSNGDTLEYQNLLKDDIRPGLKDIVWAWEGD